MTLDSPEDRADLDFDRRVHRLFSDLLDLPSSVRKERLDEAGAREPELAEKVEKLLEAAEDTTVSALADAPDRAQAVAQNLAADHLLRPGEAVGVWRIVREIGHGGMARVYLAERTEGGFGQRAALKVLEKSSEAASIRERFHQEREILGSLAHPSIAGIIDGGSLPDGRPYFALEHVDGLPIDLYCEKETSSLEQRVRLMVDVARAVHHAHRNLVVHRDLKPSNLFVTTEGDVKLLDFGIAKVLAPGHLAEGEGSGVPVTRTLVRLMTPTYASPEQVRGEPVTTASDVYQLGLLLYLLICGESAQTFDRGTWGEVEEVVCRRPPRRPSQVRADAGSGGPKIPEDLERIVLMALRKEPTRRYASADHLAEDLRRFLAGETVSARPDTMTYRAVTFARRNRVAVAVTAFSMALLSLAVVLLVLQSFALRSERDRARAEARKSTAIKDYLVSLFEDAAPSESGDVDVTVRDVLELGTARIDHAFRDQPLVRAEMQATAGGLYQALGLFPRAADLLERSLESLGARDVASRFDYEGRLATILQDQGKFQEAERLLLEALEGRRRTAEAGRLEDSYTLAALQLDYGELLIQMRRLSEATALFGEVRRRIPEETAEGRVLHARALVHLAEAKMEESELPAAEAFARESLRLKRQFLPRDHPQLLVSLSQLASILRHLDRLEEAEKLQREVLQRTEAMLGERHPYLPHALTLLAQTLRLRGELEEAMALQLRALDIRRSRLDPAHPSIAISLNDLGTLMSARGDLEAAEARFREALQIFDPADPWRRVSVTNLASVLRRRGQHEEAITLLSEMLEEDRRQLGPQHANVALDLWELGLNRAAQGYPEEARARLEEAATIYDAILPSDHPRAALLDSYLAGVLLDLGDLGGAGELLAAAGPVLEQRHGDSKHLARYALGQARLHLARGEAPRAEPHLRLAERHLAGLNPADDAALTQARKKFQEISPAAADSRK